LKSNNKFLAAFTALLVAGCTADTQAPAAKSEPATKRMFNTEPSKVVFFDSEVFDLQLSNAVRSDHSRVIVTPSGPISINSIPVRLNAWLVAVQRRGGTVNLVELRESPDGKQQEFAQFLLPIALDVLSKIVSARVGAATTENVTRDVLDYVQKDPLFLGTDNLLVTIRYKQRDKLISNLTFQKL